MEKEEKSKGKTVLISRGVGVETTKQAGKESGSS